MSEAAADWLLPDWPAPTRVRALTTSSGGIETPFGGFNLALHVGDDSRRVEANRLQLQRRMGVDAIQWLHQAHGDAVFALRGAVQSSPPTADALYSDVCGVALAVLTADCLPVVFCDQQGREIAVAHAGWRGLAGGVLNRTLEQFDQTPARLLAWLGPAISQPCFEVGEEVRAGFLESELFRPLRLVGKAFQPSVRPGHFYCDLFALARLNLRAAGVEHIYGGGQCTYSNPQRYYSYRRQPRCGRMATVVALQSR